jgi:hypothetical protein
MGLTPRRGLRPLPPARPPGDRDGRVRRARCAGLAGRWVCLAGRAASEGGRGARRLSCSVVFGRRQRAWRAGRNRG